MKKRKPLIRLLTFVLTFTFVLHSFSGSIYGAVTTGYHLEYHDTAHGYTAGNHVDGTNGICTTCKAATVTYNWNYWNFYCGTDNTPYAQYICASYICFNPYCSMYNNLFYTCIKTNPETGGQIWEKPITDPSDFFNKMPSTEACPGYEVANTYSVVYNKNGGTGTMANSSHTYDTAKKLSANTYTKTGYTFQEWNTRADGSGTSYGDKESVKNLTSANNGTANLYAVWKANNYTVTFHANGGTTPTASKSVTYDSTYGTLPTPTKSGSTFAGWYTALNNGTKITSSTKVSTASNHTLYAVWNENNYTVTYNANGGTTNAGRKTYNYGDAVSLTPTATKSGYTFVGWATSPTATKPVTSITMPAGNLTLYALYSIEVSDVSNHTYPAYNKIKNNEVELMVWKLSSPAAYKSYPLIYTADAGIMYYTYQLNNTNLSAYVGSTPFGYKIIAYDNAGNYSTILKGTSDGTPPPSEPEPTPSYWQTVNHYYAKANGDWIHFDTTSSYEKKGITFTPTYVTPPTGYRTDHIDPAYTVTGAKTSNAYYMPIAYTLIFDANGGSVTPTSKSILYNDYYGDMPTPVRAGHTFTGWYTSVSGGIEVFDKTIYTTAGNSTVYAHWTANTYQVQYDYQTNGGTSASKTSDSVIYHADVDLSPDATKEGWEFVGWNTNPDATTGLTSLKMGSENITLYAIYKKDITATFIDGSNKNISTIKNTIYNRTNSCEIITPAITTIDGWNMRGWSFDDAGDATIHVSPNVSYSLSADTIFYACYVQNIEIGYDTNGSSQEISSQTNERFFNASGNFKNPIFELAEAPVLDKHSFVKWEELNSDGTIINSYYPKQSITADHNITLTARWDKYPEIEAYDRYFTLEDAINGAITEESLLEKVTATDKEDGALEKGSDVIVKDYQADDFKNLSTDTDVTITYQATDSFGNVVEKNVVIHVVDTTMVECLSRYYSRFISSKFYSDGESLLSEEQGGLKESSIWRRVEAYNRVLNNTLNNSKTNEEYKRIDYFGLDRAVKVAGSGTWERIEETWTFTKTDLEAVEEFTLEHGLGNLKESDAVEKFMELFGVCIKENNK